MSLSTTRSGQCSTCGDCTASPSTSTSLEVTLSLCESHSLRLLLLNAVAQMSEERSSSTSYHVVAPHGCHSIGGKLRTQSYRPGAAAPNAGLYSRSRSAPRCGSMSSWILHSA